MAYEDNLKTLLSYLGVCILEHGWKLHVRIIDPGDHLSFLRTRMKHFTYFSVGLDQAAMDLAFQVGLPDGERMDFSFTNACWEHNETPNWDAEKNKEIFTKKIFLSDFKLKTKRPTYLSKEPRVPPIHEVTLRYENTDSETECSVETRVLFRHLGAIDGFQCYEDGKLVQKTHLEFFDAVQTGGTKESLSAWVYGGLETDTHLFARLPSFAMERLKFSGV